MNEQCKITIVDAPCGAGKTSFAIQYMNNEIFERFIYITPFLSEIDRVIKSCDCREFRKPSEKLGKGSKQIIFTNQSKKDTILFQVIPYLRG